ncbi:MAG: hypothetical protein AMXMBFR53_38860 [Gemmatimonadota bacterium]
MIESRLPEPRLEPSSITYDEYVSCTPERFEVIEGHLFDEPGSTERRQKLLALLLKDLGLLEAVQLAPEERWRQALLRAYGR